MSVYDYTSPSVAEFRVRQAMTRRYWVCVSPRSISFFGRGASLGLVVEGEDGRLGLVLVMSVYDYTSPSVAEFQARQARTRRYWVCVSPRSVSTSWSGLWLFLTVWQWGREPLLERARPFGRGGAPFWKGMFTLTWWVRKGAPKIVVYYRRNRLKSWEICPLSNRSGSTTEFGVLWVLHTYMYNWQPAAAGDWTRGNFADFFPI